MVEKPSPFEAALLLVEKLTPPEKLRLIEQLASTLEHDISALPQKPLKSVYGLWANLNVDISEEDVSESRREVWSTFPQQDI
jgi:hypothetical protein